MSREHCRLTPMLSEYIIILIQKPHGRGGPWFCKQLVPINFRWTHFLRKLNKLNPNCRWNWMVLQSIWDQFPYYSNRCQLRFDSGFACNDKWKNIHFSWKTNDTTNNSLTSIVFYQSVGINTQTHTHTYTHTHINMNTKSVDLADWYDTREVWII